MKTSIAFIAAAVLALSPLTGLAHEPKQADDFGSGEHSAASSGVYGHATTQAQQQQDGDGGPDTTEMILWTLAAAGAAAVLAIIGYFIRLRIGYFPHRPPPRDGNASQDHH